VKEPYPLLPNSLVELRDLGVLAIVEFLFVFDGRPERDFEMVAFLREAIARSAHLYCRLY
jgi:hypothetical protein